MANSHVKHLLIALAIAVHAADGLGASLHSTIHMILKSGTQGFTTDPNTWEKNIANLVSTHVKNKDSISPEEIAMIQTVIDALTNKTSGFLVALENAHNESVTELADLFSKIAQCRHEVVSRELHVTALKDISDGLTRENELCLGELVHLIETNATSCGHFYTWLAAEKNGNGPHCEDVSKPSDGLKKWLLDNREWFRDRYPKYVEKENNCTVAQDFLLAKMPICDNLELTSAAAWCQFCKETRRSNSKYDHCYFNATNNYESFKNETDILIINRKTEYEATKRAVCYLTILTQEAFTTEALEKCDSMSVPTDMFDIPYPPIPEKKAPAFPQCSDVSVSSCPWFTSLVNRTSGQDQDADTCRNVVLANSWCDVAVNMDGCRNFKTGKDCCPVSCAPTTTTTTTTTQAPSRSWTANARKGCSNGGNACEIYDKFDCGCGSWCAGAGTDVATCKATCEDHAAYWSTDAGPCTGFTYKEGSGCLFKTGAPSMWDGDQYTCYQSPTAR